MDLPKIASETQEASIKDYLLRYVRYWYIFLFAVIIALVAAFVYLRYTIPLYSTQATIIIKDENSGGDLSALTPFSNVRAFSGFRRNMVDDELEIFICDTGKGINGEATDKLLSKGVGLSNTNERLIKMYGTGIELSENKPKGLCVHFSIPLNKIES